MDPKNNSLKHEIALLQEELTLAKEEARRAREEAAQAGEARSRLLFSLSEELRGPLTTVLGFGEILNSTQISRSPALEQILSAGQRLLDVISQIDAHALDPSTGELNRKQPSTVGAEQNPTATILYVEDCAANCKLVEAILSLRPGVRIVSAPNAKTGIELARHSRPQLILIDLNLPDMHGSELLRLFRADPATAAIPVIVISGDATPTQIERMLAAGARHYLTKPFEMKRFLYTVDEILQPAA